LLQEVAHSIAMANKVICSSFIPVNCFRLLIVLIIAG
jgi:hypothetical protein